MDNFLVFENISKCFGTQVALDSVSVALRKGEIFSLLGPSGCGKTTLLRIAAGLERPDLGRVYLNGADITEHAPNDRSLNTVFQSYALFPHLSVWDNIAFGPRISGSSKARVQEAVERMLHLTRLEQHAAKKPAQLSGGQRQRTAIARALINEPEVLLLDEPLAALDLKLRQHLLLELVRLHEQVGTTFLYVTHDQDEAMGTSNRIAVLNEGSVEQIGTPQELYENPATSFVAEFIGDANVLNGVAAGIAAEEASLCSVTVPPLGLLLCRTRSPVATGTRVRVQLRPEKLEVLKAQPGAEQGFEAVQGTVSEVMYFGAYSKYWVAVGDARLAAMVPHSRAPHETGTLGAGATVWLRWRTDSWMMIAHEP